MTRSGTIANAVLTKMRVASATEIFMVPNQTLIVQEVADMSVRGWELGDCDYVLRWTVDMKMTVVNS